MGERKKSNTYNIVGSEKYVSVKLDMNIGDTKITRYVDKQPFVPSNDKKQ